MGQNINKYAYDYNIDFNKKYNKNRKYSFIYITDAHEFTTLEAEKGDIYLLNYIKKLEEEKILDDTMLILFSDHG